MKVVYLNTFNKNIILRALFNSCFFVRCLISAVLYQATWHSEKRVKTYQDFAYLHYSHPIPSVRRAVELSVCAACIGLLRSVRMSSAECLLKLFGALSFEGRVEYSSSILYHSSQNAEKIGLFGRGSAHWEIKPVVSEVLSPQQDAYR